MRSTTWPYRLHAPQAGSELYFVGLMLFLWRGLIRVFQFVRSRSSALTSRHRISQINHPSLSSGMIGSGEELNRASWFVSPNLEKKEDDGNPACLPACIASHYRNEGKRNEFLYSLALSTRQSVEVKAMADNKARLLRSRVKSVIRVHACQSRAANRGIFP